MDEHEREVELEYIDEKIEQYNKRIDKLEVKIAKLEARREELKSQVKDTPQTKSKPSEVFDREFKRRHLDDSPFSSAVDARISFEYRCVGCNVPNASLVCR